GRDFHASTGRGGNPRAREATDWIHASTPPKILPRTTGGAAAKGCASTLVPSGDIDGPGCRRPPSSELNSVTKLFFPRATPAATATAWHSSSYCDQGFLKLANENV
uniref:Uncharacterized protein n=1 Tax=Triticum urartu TaxID=4572 RepID=A0A8R7PW76_TRIUA